MSSELFRLDNAIQKYDWGSRTVLAELQGRPSPTGEPEAELWIGAHPKAPSLVTDVGSLLDVIDSDPQGLLGPEHSRLPFLLKILAVDKPLSIQVHPDAEQAAKGFAAESHPFGDPRRTYQDDWPKPELIYALTRFEALCGFREPAESAALLDVLGGERLGRVAAALRSGGPKQALTLLAGWPAEDRAELVAEVRRGCADRTEPSYAWALRIAADYPADPGVVISLLLNLVVLEPGQALYARPRTLHAYLRGTGVEIMASSDNVLRGGLTPKHVALEELLAVTTFTPGPPDLVEGVSLPDGEVLFPTPAAQFQLTRLRLGPPVEILDAGPGAILCVEGSVEVSRGSRTELLHGGDAVFVPHSGGPLRIGGAGLAFRAAVPGPTFNS
jgi:mannose-6-phosphate isomerase